MDVCLLTRRRKLENSWQASFFRDVALDFWRRAVTPEQTRAEVDFLERALAVGPGAHLLDVPCGNGRHATEFLRRGYSVTGVDISAEFLEEARGANGNAAHWVLGDMCDLPWAGAFDGAYCFGNSFGYLDREGAARFVAAVSRSLKPGARFVIDTGMAAESILPTLLARRWHRAGDMFVLSENRYHAAEGRLDIDYTFIHQGGIETRPTSSYVFTVGEICRLHADAGFDPAQLLASTEREPYRIGSPRLLLVSEKR